MATDLFHIHRFVAGEVFAMTGATEAHNLIVANVIAGIHAQLKVKPCRVYPSDLKIRIETEDIGAYPDVMVICGEPTFYDDRRDVVTNPILIVAVLSASSQACDRGDKFRHYRALPSLQTYLLLSQDRMQAELFARQADGSWQFSAFGEPADRVPLTAVEGELLLTEIYDRVTLGA
ncbi:MAG: Uma2 family endonuclease [Thiohalocapsa sp.]|uniref:Uma2 family endonuclease n=1 Tax=Thiohalocapsa sp. TaxID=2497641 RepID=UPI0025EFEC20|nr:Uma2 family endonuclease [Thiohalocapsa sp.]MCG6941691.1 Uma2 family endonuclease [Thiohalocapsa sp.]